MGRRGSRRWSLYDYRNVNGDSPGGHVVFVRLDDTILAIHLRLALGLRA